MGVLARSVQTDYRLNRLFFKQCRQLADANKLPKKPKCHYFDANLPITAKCQLWAAGADLSANVDSGAASFFWKAHHKTA
ncbi:Uncharacterized protein ALO40_05295 [Pseudomonas syringae pv. viburni]|uniref:Uncharacterized protein n=1 Tax=Pseudomonas syringae pv. viburni TaxID=251703 RepID=A0A0Q0ENP2_9PSED|nr:Uncharacterized protein ALO40_05295 [Pseudomonas syringae pv. viburni]